MYGLNKLTVNVLPGQFLLHKYTIPELKVGPKDYDPAPIYRRRVLSAERPAAPSRGLRMSEEFGGTAEPRPR